MHTSPAKGDVSFPARGEENREADVRETTWQRALSELRGAFDAQACSIVVHYYANGRGRLAEAVGIDPDHRIAYDETYSAENVWLQDEPRFRSPGTVTSSQEILGDDEVTASRFYKEWLQPQDLLHHIFAVVDRQGQTVVCIALARSKSQGAFGARDVGKLRAILPAVSAAWRLWRLARARAALTTTTWKLLDQLSLGIVLVEGRGRITGLNNKALEILTSNDAIAMQNGHLICGRNDANGQLRKILKDLLGGTPSKSGEISKALAIPRADSAAPLQLVVSRLDTGGAGRPRPVAAIFISDPERMGSPREEWLRDLYGLTRVESQLAVLLCQGHTPDQIAERMRVSVHTVRAYLKNMFLKMGVNRQSAMVRRLVNGPGQLRSNA